MKRMKNGAETPQVVEDEVRSDKWRPITESDDVQGSACMQ